MFLFALDLVFFLLGIWLGQRANDLGPMPYRWGTFVGIETAWLSLLFVLSSVRAFSPNNVAAASDLAGLALLAAIASIGILRRSTFGVVAFALTYAALFLLSPFLESLPGESLLVRMRSRSLSVSESISRATLPYVLAAVSGIAYVICTLMYFKRRWAYMKKRSGFVATPGATNSN